MTLPTAQTAAAPIAQSSPGRRRAPSNAQRIVIAPSTGWTRPRPAPFKPGQTIEDFKTQGGEIERLPAAWERP